MCFDKDYNSISHRDVSLYNNTKTTLTKAINNGDTTIEVASTANWQPANISSSYKWVGIYNRTDGSGYHRLRVSRAYVSFTGNTITLSTPWDAGTVPVGTNVGNAADGSGYLYTAATNLKLTSDYQSLRGDITGWSDGWSNPNKFRYGTEYVKILFLLNYNQDNTHITRFKDIRLVNISRGQQIKTNSITNKITKESKLITEELIELDTYSINTKTEHGADWVEIFFHDSQGGTVLFNDGKDKFLKCNETNRRSILYRLDEFRKSNGSFEFMLEYEDAPGEYNRWEQKSNFTTTIRKVIGYSDIHLDWTDAHWGGLSMDTRTETYVDGSPNSETWYYAIGSILKYGLGIPTSSDIGSTGSTANWVKLWVRIDSPNIFKLYKDGSTRTTEIIEI